MVYQGHQWAQEYSASLVNYLAMREEAGLTRAYELGRQAVAAGMGLVDIVGLHTEALRALSAGQANSEALEKALAAHEFLIECLAPSEMVFRGFQEANATLRQLNQTLEQRVKERTLELEVQAGRLRAQLRRVRALQREVKASRSPGDPNTSIDAVASAVGRESPDLRPHTAPDGTVTVLFSDIEGSTALTRRLGDQRAQELVRAHNTLIRQQLQAYEGFEVKFLGDGFMLAFSSARRAVQCAIAVQREFANYNDAHPDEPLRVRIGLHAGEPIPEGDDFYSRSVIRAARIADQAQGEEILVSSLLKELVEIAGDIQFGEGREVALEGLAGTSRVYPVYWE